jgi:hypothetical protein
LNDFDKCEFKCDNIKLNSEYYDPDRKIYKKVNKINLDTTTFSTGFAKSEIEYCKRKIKELYIIEFEKILIKNQKKQPFKQGTDIKHTTPSVTFLKLISEKPTGLKKGDRILFNLNITDRVRFKGKEEYIILNYVEKVNLISPILVNNKSTNKNCFIVTTTMGDVNHPVVVDFRRYRDEVLLNTYFGRKFINIYYRIGPFLSKVIKTNRLLFLISKKMILKLHKTIK